MENESLLEIKFYDEGGRTRKRCAKEWDVGTEWLACGGRVGKRATDPSPVL